MSTSHSITILLQNLEKDESQAARELWQRCLNNLIRNARKGLKRLPRRVLDEEDIAITAFDAFLRGAKCGRFERLRNREDLWQVLAMLAERKATAAIRSELAQKRGGGRSRGESVFEQVKSDSSARCGINEVGDARQPATDQLPLVVREMIEELDKPLLRQIALARLEGYTDKEIAEQADVALRTIERKLSGIRRFWQDKLND